MMGITGKCLPLHCESTRKEDVMARPIRETPILYGKDARRFEAEMRRVDNLSPQERNANREKLKKEYERICKEWNLTFKI